MLRSRPRRRVLPDDSAQPGAPQSVRTTAPRRCVQRAGTIRTDRPRGGARWLQGPDTKHAAQGGTHVPRVRSYQAMPLRRGDGDGVLGHDADLIVDDLEKSAFDIEALFSLGGVEPQRAPAQQRHERRVHR